MKKNLLVSSVLLTCAINANAFYIGIEQSLSNSVTNETNSIETDNNSNITAIKIGTRVGDGSSKASRMEFAYELGAETSNFVVGKGKSVTSFALNYNATFDSISPMEQVLPYLKVGASYVIASDKYRDINTGKEYNYSAAGLLIGVGSYYNFNENLDISAGYDMGYRQWQDLYYRANTVESEDKYSRFYIGTNYSF